MSTADAVAPSAPTGQGFSPAIAFVVWTAACVAMLAVTAFRVKLAAQVQPPIEDAAITAASVVALMVGSWLAPVLVNSRSQTVIAISTAAPLLLIAGFVSGQTMVQSLSAVVLVAFWLAAYHIALRWPVLSQGIALLATAGPLFWYLSQEFAPTPIHLTDWAVGLSPTLGAVAISTHSTAIWPLLGPPMAVFAVRAAQLVGQMRAKPTASSTSAA